MTADPLDSARALLAGPMASGLEYQREALRVLLAIHDALTAPAELLAHDGAHTDSAPPVVAKRGPGRPRKHPIPG